MAFFKKNNEGTFVQGAGTPKKHRVWRIVGFFLILFLIGGGIFAWKTGAVLNKISQGNANIFGSLLKSIPGAEKKLVGEDSGRINILLLGMRGEGVTGGGLLADTIMLLSIHPKKDDTDTSRVSLVSIPRDTYVTVPNRNEQRKINAVYALGEERLLHKGGIEDMRTIVGEVTGLEIPYAVTLNFQGFKDLVNAVGGVTIHLDQPFEERLQFRGLEKRCDLVKYTVPSGNVETKKGTRRDGSVYYRHYDLCFEKMTTVAIGELECGGDFKLPAGDNVLDGDKALCYARSRYTSNDFERARRQQDVINLIRAKALSIGTLTDFSKINTILDSLGKNVSTNMEAWEMKRLFDLYQKVGEVKINQKVLENSEEGLLYAPPETKEAGYILLPRGDNYDRIHELFANSLNQ
jgi:LCP family protein required for cell wall assembly